ncbi:MAG TPA: porin [Steroidobacteraceae bacterium]|jgi:predicted porin|nr:porin [Steroidobacteraceae bacterium]
MNRNYLLAAACGLALAGTTAGADMKDPLPDSLSLGGVTVYGTIDVGYAYQNHGVPLNGTYPGGLEYQAFTTTRNFAGSVSTVAESGLEQSKIGLRIAEPIVEGWTLVGRLETGFNPLSGQLTDACASIANNGPNKQGNQTANADSSRCGQALNSMAWGGVSNAQFGQLTVGRHNSLQLDALAVYDPQTLSYAFSFLGYSGFNGGAGSTQAARWDNSARYAVQTGPVHVALMYSNGGADTGIIGKAYAGEIGVTIQALSLDAVYENEKSAVNLRSSFDDGGVNPLTTPAGPGLPPPGLAAYISDDTSWNLMGKYVFEFGDSKLKDKLTLYAAYSHIQKAHGDYNGGSAQGGYPLDVGININDAAVYNMEWVGARYAFSSGLNLVAAYYHITQNSWTIGLGPTAATGLGCAAAGLLCSGDFDEASFVVDYVFNKHYDLYAGLNWSEVQDGLANGFVGTTVGTSGSESQTTFMVGGRVKF